MVLDALVDEKIGVIKDTSKIAAVGHRVVHGGKYYSNSVFDNRRCKKNSQRMCGFGTIACTSEFDWY